MTPIEKAAQALSDNHLLVSDGHYTEAARAVLQAIREPSKEMLEVGITTADNCKDSDWDSGCDGESHNSYEYLRSDAPLEIWQAMIDAALSE